MKPGAVTSVPSPSLQITPDRFISFRFLQYKPIIRVAVHSIQQLQEQSLSLSVFHSVVVRTAGPVKDDDFCTCKRGAAGALNAGHCGTYNTDFPALANENSCLIKSYTRVYRLPFLFTKRVPFCLTV